MNRPRYKELYLEEKNKFNELKGVLKQYRNVMKLLSDKKIICFKTMPSPCSFDDLDVISFVADDNFYKMAIVRESVEEE